MATYKKGFKKQNPHLFMIKQQTGETITVTII
jgi:hypothetical protein